MDENRISPMDECIGDTEMDWSAESLLAAARSRGLVVYGTGYVANMFRIALEARGVWDCVQACIVTEAPAPGVVFHGVTVEQAAAWASAQVDAAGAERDRSEPLVCLAVHEAILPQIREQVSQLGLVETVWVYPLIHELAFGAPLERGRRIDVTELLAAQPSDWHWIAARACAFERDKETRLLGESAYVKCMTLHCGEQTARRRLEQARMLADDIERDGFNPEKHIRIDGQLRIIDGLHRVALAWLRGEEHVSANVYAVTEVYDRLFTEDNKLTPAVLGKADLTAGEHELLERIQQEISPAGFVARTPEISIIMPAYNVVDYIDQCIESVVAQTFGDFEVLLIDDGSADGTSEKCDAWSARDARIRAIHQPNAGVSTARNRGIEESRGTYLAFVDPDDWLDERYLEKLHARAVETGADFVECDIWRYDNRNGSRIWRHCGQRMGVPYTLDEHMKYGPTASYKILAKRSLWVDNNVWFPSCAFESPAVYALVLALANKVEYLPEPLYYYRRFRENSLVENGYAHQDGSANNTLGIEAMAHLCDQFKERGLYDRFATDMPGLVTYRLNDILAMQYHRRSSEDFAQLVDNQRAFLEREFPQLPQGAYITWGGYNLNKIMQHLPMLNDPSCRFNFSSIVAIAWPGEGAEGATVHHENRYREMMLHRELDQVFWDVLAAQHPLFVFMDFIDERFDLLKWRGRYLTASDAWEGAQTAGIEPEGRIAFGSEEHLALWRASFDAFAARLAQSASDTRIVIVENYLSERVGTLAGTSEYDDAGAIRATNEALKSMYNHVQERIPEIAVIPAFSCEDYFTDEAYEYGAVPQHLNDIVNQRIAQLIEEVVF